MSFRLTICSLASLLLTQFANAQDTPSPNTWTKLDKAVIECRRCDVPIGYSPELKRFLVLGGRITQADSRKPRSYDQLALDRGEGRFENWYPKGKDWGPKFGKCNPPPWKNEFWQFQETDGVVRPNWSVYGTFSLGQKYDYDPDSKNFVFYAGGSTFSYDPVERQWSELSTKTHPDKELGGRLLWSSMTYDRHNKQFVLFGGGNVQTERGDPGTWVFKPADKNWTQFKPDSQPPQRANSRICFDPLNKKVILFGGDQLDRLLADTWTFDVVDQKWEQKKPALGPGPRAGHALLWLPKSQKILLLGGYGYTSTIGYVDSLYRRLPLEAWIYDLAKDRWDLVKRFREKEIPEGSGNGFLSAAADENDNVLVVGGNGSWICRFDASQTDADGALKYGVKPGASEQRTGSHDPQWYKEGVPAPDPAKVVEDLKSLPANKWVVRPTPRLPKMNMDWGSAVFAADLDLIVRFSGGHSAYSGTAPQVYDIKNDRYTIPFAPEYPIEFVYSNDQVSGEWSFKGNPWMTGHTYKSTGYDPHLKSLVFAAHDLTYFFDPLAGKWSRNTERCPFVPNMYIVTLCDTPQGAVAWADKRKGGVGLWRLDAASRIWKELKLAGDLPAKSPDQHGMAYDSKRDRLLLFSNVGPTKGNVTAYDLKSGEAKLLDAEGKDKAAVPSRETIYIPELDAVLIGARVSVDGKLHWVLYDCAKNAWFGAELAGADPIGKGTSGNSFNNSIGLMFDPNRNLVWSVGQYSNVHVIRIDPKSVVLRKLN